ncbi:MAG: tetratricopeptide repeat protein, partial [Planctomycetota bacterium]
HRFSWVADHFIYLASVAVLVMIIASLASIPTLRSRLGAVLAGIVLLVAAILSHQHTKTFESLDTLWLTTIERTPSSWMPNNNMSSLMLRRAGVAMDAGDTDLKHAFAREARDFALRAIELKPDHANAHSNAAEAFRLIDDVGTALYHQQTAIDLLEARADVDRRHKELADEYFKRGRLEHLQKRWDDTETSFRRAVDLHPEHMMYWQELAQFYERQDRLDDAIIVYGTMLDLEPEFAPIIARLARLLLEQVRYDESIALLERSLESTDDELLRCQFLDMLANIHASAGSFEIAIRLATEARDIAIRLDVPILRDGIPSRLESYQNSLDARRNGAGPPTPSR